MGLDFGRGGGEYPYTKLSYIPQPLQGPLYDNLPTKQCTSVVQYVNLLDTLQIKFIRYHLSAGLLVRCPTSKSLQTPIAVEAERK